MKVFITGVSKGLGEALALLFLKEGHQVNGIGRSHSIVHENFQFISCDLSDREQVDSLDFGSIDEEVLFINNAGFIGNIQRLSDQKEPDVFDVMMVNAISPMLFCAKIARAVDLKSNLTVINISSGAARRSIPSWASYCASKAALDRFSETFYLEELEKDRNIRVYSVAPGVIDTAMQQTIRSSKESDFSSVSRFIELQQKEELRSVGDVVQKIIYLLENPSDNLEVICAV